ncbi:MAG: rRNA maturation RNase YbeY [Minisyncoccia bacterium]
MKKNSDEILDKKIKKNLNKILKILKKEKKFKKFFLKYNPPLVFVANSIFMRKLKKHFFGLNKEADVLAFNWPKDFIQGKNKPPLGEIYLNKKIIKKEEKLKHLLTHAVLHLLGFNHFKKNDIIKMEKKEQEILGRL